MTGTSLYGLLCDFIAQGQYPRLLLQDGHWPCSLSCTLLRLCLHVPFSSTQAVRHNPCLNVCSNGKCLSERLPYQKKKKKKKDWYKQETSGVNKTSAACHPSPAPCVRTVLPLWSVASKLLLQRDSGSYISCMTTAWSDTAADFTSQGGTLLWTSVIVCLCVGESAF